MNYYERHIGDYLKDTAHLSLLHHGIYARLLDVYYTREHGFAEGEAHRLIGARSKDERTATDEVLCEFFILHGTVWIQERCDREIARYRDKQEKARRSAEARWSESGRNANAFPSGDAKPMRTHCEGNALQSPDTSLQLKDKAPSEPPAPPLRVVPAAPPPAFDGNNAKSIPGRAVVLLNDAFDLPEEWGVDAEALGFPRSRILVESERFRQYWTKGKGQGKRKSLRGWRQAWSNWLGKAAERAA